MSRLDDVFGGALAPRAPAARKTKRTTPAEPLAPPAPWTPPAPFGHEPRPRQTPEEWAAYWERYAPPRYVSPRERPELAHPCQGIADVTDEEIAAWVDADPFVRGGLRPQTQRALVFLTTFAPKKRAANASM